jgi:hypothetical protein
MIASQSMSISSVTIITANIFYFFKFEFWAGSVTLTLSAFLLALESGTHQMLKLVRLPAIFICWI